MAIPGDQLQTFIQVVDPTLGDAPQLGLTVTPDLIAGPDGIIYQADPPSGSADQFSFTELTNGYYAVYYQTLTSDPSGDYEAHFHVNDVIDGVPENSAFTQNWNVLPSNQYGGVSVSGTSRRDIRRRVARMLSDYYEATEVLGGETNRLRDPVMLARETNFFKGMQILFTNPDSPNLGRVARVTQSDGPNATIYFEPPVPELVVPGETIEMYNFRGRGTSIDQYNGAINDAILQARQQHGPVPFTLEMSDAFLRTSPYITIPAAFSHFTSLETTDRDGYLYQIRPQDVRVDRMSRRVEVRNRHAIDRLNGLTLTIVGYAMPALLDHDDDQTNIDVEWLFSEVKASLLERMIVNGNPVGMQDRLFVQERNESAGKRAMIVFQAMPNTVALP